MLEAAGELDERAVGEDRHRHVPAVVQRLVVEVGEAIVRRGGVHAHRGTQHFARCRVRHRLGVHGHLIRNLRGGAGVGVEPRHLRVLRQRRGIQQVEQRQQFAGFRPKPMRARDLIHQHLALLELQAVVAKADAVRHFPVLVEEIAHGGFVVGVAQEQGGGGDLVILAETGAQVQVAGHVHGIGGFQLRIRALVGEVEVAAEALAFAPVGLVGTADQEAKLQAAADEEAVADAALQV